MLLPKSSIKNDKFQTAWRFSLNPRSRALAAQPRQAERVDQEKKIRSNSRLKKWRRGDQGKAIQQNNQPTWDLRIFTFIPTRPGIFSIISSLIDSDSLLLWPQLLPFPNHRYYFFKVPKSSDDERLHLISRFAGWRLAHTRTPQVPNQRRENAVRAAFPLLFPLLVFPPLSACWEKSLLEYFLIYIVRNLCWCAWVGDLVLFFKKASKQTKKRPSA